MGNGMQSHLLLFLGALGTLAGLVYCYLGFVALKYLPSADTTDRTLGWTLLWFLEFRRYSAPGKRLCAAGAAVLAFGTAAWIGCYLVDRAS
jgi:hypothetical protein